ncbi:MAG: DUF3488 and transglutaminase-like domain-containing protein [Propionibacteriaceae bacterium]|nr:DUF3488 and transglutaminase-like domain-containing protein [Propionibacteriaceae bacterium]
MRSRRSALLPLVVSGAMVLGMLALGPLTALPLASATILLPLAVAGVISAFLALLGLGRLPSLLLATLGALAVLVWFGLNANPASDPLQALQQLLTTGVGVLRNSTLPLPAHPALEWLLATTALLLWFVADFLVEVLEQPAWSLVPLALPFTITAVVIPTDVPATGFLMVAAGFIAVLLSAGGAGFTNATISFHLSRWVVGLGAAAVAAALAIGVSSVLPMGPKQPWLLQGNDTPIQLGDPTLDLTRNLHRESPADILSYRASDGQSHYLRTTALTRITPDGAQLESMRLRSSGIGDAYDAPGKKVDFQVSMHFASQYLPAPFAPESWDAEGSWGFDQNTLSIVATGQGGSEQTTNLDYRTTATVPNPSAQELAAARAGSDPNSDETRNVPDGLSPQVLELLEEITADAASDGEAALAIQNYLNSDHFEYTLQAPNATDTNSINAFLLEDRAGYCVHFASAMTVLARAKGIPARIGIGFTGGTPSGDSYLVTTDNMHAWPELYFEGMGWIAFEPTKGFGSSDTNSTPSAPPSQDPNASPSASPSPTQTETETIAPSPSPSPSADASPSTPANPGSQDAKGGGGLLGWVGVALLVPLVVLVPAGIRTALRMWRLRSGQPPNALAAGAWQELAATFRDLGLPWRTGSPLTAVAQLWKSLPPLTAAHLASVAETVQRCQYARETPAMGGLAAKVKALRKELLARAPRGRRALAFLAPASLLPRPRRRTQTSG